MLSVYLSSFLLILNCVFFGIGNAFTSDILDRLPLFTFLSLRFGLAFLIFVILFHHRLMASLSSLKRGVWQLLSICVFTAVAYIAANLSLSLAKPSVAGFMISVSVIFAPFLTALFYKTRVGVRIYPIILLTLAGLFLLCDGFYLQVAFGWGEIFGLLCSAFFAAQLVSTGKYLIQYRWDPILLATVQAGFLTVICLPCAILCEPSFPWREYGFKEWFGLGYIVIFCTVLLYIFQNYALARVSPVFASVAMSTEMIFTMIAAYFICGDSLSVSAMIGGVLIFISVVLASLFTENVTADPTRSGQIEKME